MKRVFGVLGLIASMLGTPTHAQDVMMNTIGSDYAMSVIQRNVRDTSLSLNGSTQRSRPAGGAYSPTRTYAQDPAGATDLRPFRPETLAYRPTRALAQATVDGYVERLRRKNPDASRALAEQFSRNDYGQIYRGVVRPFGLNDGNAADSLTAYTVLCWMIATGAGDPGKASVQAVREQIGSRMAADLNLSSPANRAKAGEEFKLLFVTLHAGWQSVQKEGNLRSYADGVAAMFAQQGTDLRRLRLTSAGLAAR